MQEFTKKRCGFGQAKMELEKKRMETLDKNVKNPRSELYIDGLLVSLRIHWLYSFITVPKNLKLTLNCWLLGWN